MTLFPWDWPLGTGLLHLGLILPSPYFLYPYELYFYIMDLSKLKKRPAYPFETIAVAIAFSPRLSSVIGEAKLLSESLGATLLLMHIGQRTTSKEKQLDEILTKLGTDDHKIRIIWMEGETVETLLRLCKLNIVDLLVLGALEKESFLKFYMGSVARSISRKAKCSVLMLTHPQEKGTKRRRFVVNGVENPKTIHTINTALYLAKNLKARDVNIVKEVDIPGFAMTMADNNTAPEQNKIRKEITEEENSALHEIVDQVDTGDLKVTEKLIKGKPGYAISSYARTKSADLLVINSPDTQLGILDRIFTHDIEYILADLPCDVLIVHSRV